MYALGVIVVLYFYVRLGIWLAKKATANISSTPSKWLIRASVALVLFLIPFGDEIAGKIYFDHLCETEAGAKVYQTIELPAEYWDKDGKPKFYVNQYDKDKLRFVFSKDEMVTAPKLKYTWNASREHYPFHIENDVLQISEQPLGNVLGDFKLFRYWGGWMRRNLSAHNSATGCSREREELMGWEMKVFKPQPKQQ